MNDTKEAELTGMGVEIHQRFLSFKGAVDRDPAALVGSVGDFTGVLDYERFVASKSVLRLSDIGARKHRSIEQLIEFFFKQSAKLDPGWQFGFSSKVLLAIPEYGDIQPLFLLLTFLQEEPEKHAILFVPDPELYSLYASILLRNEYGGRRYLFSKALLQRFIRTFIRAGINFVRVPGRQKMLFTLRHGNASPMQDSYYGALPDLESGEDVQVLYLLSGGALRLPFKENLVPLESFASPLDVVRLFFQAFKMKWNSTQIDVGGYDLSALLTFLRDGEFNRGDLFLNLFMGYAFQRAFCFTKPELIVYPFENRSWEKQLIRAARKSGVGNIVGYQHSSITPRHLAFKINDEDMDTFDLPDKVVTSGEVSMAYLQRHAPLISHKMVAGASLRRITSDITSPGEAVVLVPISSSRREARLLVRMAYEASTMVNVRFIIRPHPTIPIEDIFYGYLSSDLIELSVGRGLNEDIERTSMTAYSSSTVALESMNYGRPAIFVDIGDIPTGDPLLEDETLRKTVRTAVELANEVARLSQLSVVDTVQLQQRMRDYSARYLVEAADDTLETLRGDLGLI